MFRTTTIAFVLMWLVSPVAQACECLWQGSFKTVVENADVVAWGIVSDRQGNSLDLTVRTLLRGEDYRQTLRVWGKKDELCRPEVDRFPVGSQWVMALQRIESPPEDGFDPFRPNISYGRKDDFYLSSCGVYWLEVNSERVSGNILEGSRWQYLDEKKTPILMSLFKAWLSGDLSDEQLAKASKPQPKVRELMNETRIFLWEQDRAEDE